MSSWWWINQWKSCAGCLRSPGVWKIHVYFGVEWQWTRAQRLCSLVDGRHHVRAPLAAVEATNEGPPALTNSHAITFREDPQSWAWLPASGREGEGGGSGRSLALSPPKTHPPLKTHSCSYLTQRPDRAQQLRACELWRQKRLRSMPCGVSWLPSPQEADDTHQPLGSCRAKVSRQP